MCWSRCVGTPCVQVHKCVTGEWPRSRTCARAEKSAEYENSSFLNTQTFECSLLLLSPMVFVLPCVHVEKYRSTLHIHMSFDVSRPTLKIAF